MTEPGKDDPQFCLRAKALDIINPQYTSFLLWNLILMLEYLPVVYII
jgi:hypothetical protein